MSESLAVEQLDLCAQYQSIKEEIDAAIAEVVQSQHFILGPQLTAFEKEFGEYCGHRLTLGVSSGSDALLLALLCCGVGPGDEVLVPDFTFFATASCVSRLGATPVFVDIDPRTFLMDTDAAVSKISNKTKAIIPVHLFGAVFNILDLQSKIDPKLQLIEDAAQAVGAAFYCESAAAWRQVGSLGDYGCFSFFPSKNLGCFGDGGLLCSPNQETHERAAQMRVHGQSGAYQHSYLGGNFRLDALQAAILRVKLRYLNSWNQARRDLAERYTSEFASAGLRAKGQYPEASSPVVLPTWSGETRPVVNQYVIRAHKRDELLSFLQSQNIAARVYYPRPLHSQEVFAGLDLDDKAFPESVRAASECLALPIYPELGEQRLLRVVQAICQYYS